MRKREKEEKWRFAASPPWCRTPRYRPLFYTRAQIALWTIMGYCSEYRVDTARRRIEKRATDWRHVR